MFKKGGFTAVEVLVAVGILVLISLLTFKSFSNLNSSQALDKAVLGVTSVLNEARSLTLSSKDESQYGVHISSGSVVLFKGATYSQSDPGNETTTLNGKVSISNINISGGSDVVFERLTGETPNTGTLTLSLVSSTSTQRTVTVIATGVIQSN